MTDIVELNPKPLTDSQTALKAAIAGIATIVTLKPETLALAEGGLRVQTLIDAISGDIEIAQTLTIDSPDMLAEGEAIAGRLASVCADSGSIEAERKALVAPFNDLVKWINDGYKRPREFIGGVLGPVKSKILAYNREVQRQAEERAAEERRQREAEAQAAAQREAAAVAEATKLAEQAQAAQAAGSEITASALLNEASIRVDAARQEATAAVTALHTRVAATPIARASGVRGTWKAEITDKAAAILHIANCLQAGDATLLGLVDLNESALNAKAKLEKEHFRLPGARSVFTESLSVRKTAVAA